MADWNDFSYDAFVAACFGTADAARFDRCFAAAFRAAQAQLSPLTGALAVTSPTVKIALRAQGAKYPSPAEALDGLFRQGRRRILVLALFLSDGAEWDRLSDLCSKMRGRFEVLTLTPPLLRANCGTVSAVLSRLFLKTEGQAVVLYGHGSLARGNAPYLRLQNALHQLGRKDMLLMLMHGAPGVQEGIQTLRAQKIRRVKLVFLTLCIGHHAQEALLPGGVKEQLERAGLETEVFWQELGQLEEFQRLFLPEEWSGTENRIF